MWLRRDDFAPVRTQMIKSSARSELSTSTCTQDCVASPEPVGSGATVWCQRYVQAARSLGDAPRVLCRL